MPTVISYDSPAVMAGLAANVSDARGGQQAFEDSLQSERLAQQQRAQQQQAALEQQRMAMQASMAQSEADLRRQQNAPAPTPAWTEGGGESGQGGPTIYHPQGEQQLAPQAMQAWTNAHAGYLGGQGGGPNVGGSVASAGNRGRGSRAGLPMNQQTALDNIDQMEQQGMLNAAEAMRWRAQVHSGENPFGQKTAAEEQADLHMKQQLSPQQQHAQERQARLDQDKEEREDYMARSAALRELIGSKEKRLKDALGDDRDKLQAEISQHEKDLQDLNQSYLESRKARRQGGQQTNPQRPLLPPDVSAASAAGAAMPAPAGGNLTMQNGVLSNPAGLSPQGVGLDRGTNTIGNAAGMQDVDRAGTQGGGQGGQSYGLSIDQALQLRNLFGSGAAARQAVLKYGSYDAAIAAAQR